MLLEEWFGTVGFWNVEVVNVDTSEEEGNDKDPLVVIIVHRPNAEDIQGTSCWGRGREGGDEREKGAMMLKIAS